MARPTPIPFLSLANVTNPESRVNGSLALITNRYPAKNSWVYSVALVTLPTISRAAVITPMTTRFLHRSLAVAEVPSNVWLRVIEVFSLHYMHTGSHAHLYPELRKRMAELQKGRCLTAVDQQRLIATLSVLRATLRSTTGQRQGNQIIKNVKMILPLNMIGAVIQ